MLPFSDYTAPFNPAKPGAIGGTTPAAGTFTVLTCTQLAASSSATMGWNSDTYLNRDAANTLALRNSTTAQAFRIYNTYTDASNYERGFMRWNANYCEVGVESLGTGSARTLTLSSSVLSGGMYSVNVQGYTTAAGNGAAITFCTSTTIGAAPNAQIYGARIDSNTSDLGLRGRIIHIGPTGAGFVGTSSYPALKRSSTTLQVRLADDSAFAPVQGKLTTDNAYSAGTFTATGYVTLYDSTGTAYRVPCAV